MQLVDTHCHLNLLRPESTAEKTFIDEIVNRAIANDVTHLVNVCVSIKDFPTLLATAKQYPQVSATVGLHPNDTDEEVSEEELFKLGQESKVIAIGETGLDYYRTEKDTQWQQERFRRHIRVARALQKPVIVHTRNAPADTIKIMQEETVNDVGGIMHCFTESWEVAKSALDLGCYISFSGIVTFKNAVSIQAVAKKVPLDRLLIETDSPYLAPEPNRGKTNEPAYVRYTASFLANMYNMSLDAFAAQTTDNFYQLCKGAMK